MQKYCSKQFNFMQVANLVVSLVKQNQAPVQGSASKFTLSTLETGLRSVSATEVSHIESLPSRKRDAFSTSVSSHSQFCKIHLQHPEV